MRPHRSRVAPLTVLILCALAARPIAADPDDRLFVRPWIELEPLYRIAAEEYPIPVPTAEKRLLEEGRVLISGMIWGWTFTWYPSDKARRAEESFTLTPVAQVAWGNPRLRVTETEVKDRRLWARILYAMNAEEAQRRSAWDSGTAELSTGRGTAALALGAAGRTAALEAAIRDAIRLSLDQRYPNKPREITGDVALWEDPVTLARSGAYAVTAKVKVVVRELVPYRIY
jgi:hypothetical protein